MTPPRKETAAKVAPTAPDPEPETTPAETPEPEPPARNVLEALQRVTRDLPAIGKGETSEQGYKYRGIEAITAHAGTLFGRHGVTFVPEVVEREVEALTINGRPWTETRLKLVYRVYGPGGIEDVLVVGPLWTAGRDNSDKGYNKCMTQGLKYALLQVLCIGDKADDVDAGEAAVADPREREPEDLTDLASKESIDELVARIRTLKELGVPVDANGWNVMGVQIVVDRRPVVDQVTLDGLLEAIADLEDAADVPALLARQAEAAELAADPDGVIVDGADAEAADPALPVGARLAEGNVSVVVEGVLGCPHCASVIDASNPVRTWPDPTWTPPDDDPDAKPPIVAGCAACEPM